MVLALADEERITDWPHLDERSAAFFALGAGAATGVPAVVACTSGTAAAELLPAVVEARYGRVPLIALTADRPARLVGTGAPQTIDQAGLYGSSSLLSIDAEAADPGTEPAALAARLWAAARTGGPVHLNLRFEEPLVPDAPPPSGDPEVRLPDAAPAAAVEIGRLDDLRGGMRGLLVAGPSREPDLHAAVTALATALDWPILADPLSGLRAGIHDRSRVVVSGDLLAGSGWLDTSPPDVVLRIGALPTSKPLWRWLEEHPQVVQVLIDPPGTRDPLGAAAHEIPGPAAPVLEAFTARALDPAPNGWCERWMTADRAATEAAAAALPDFPGELAIAATVATALPDGATLWVASSMPVRDVDMTFPSTERAVRVLSNRGANGIDGLISTALGSLAATGDHTVLLAGDLAVLHDAAALGAAARLSLPLAIVAVNNDGGGIFHFLPQASGNKGVFERHFGTPHGLDLTAVAEAFGVRASRAGSIEDVQAAIASRPDGPLLVEVRTDRHTNVEEHRSVRDAVRSALRGV
jgi:2-succinyl-5-enolpyruvyl-6-hydroxy-3-cyclohexene-1-carboxylate synthase